MKEFHWSSGVLAKRLLTVAELRAKIADLPGDAPVAALWEGQYMPLGFSIEVVDYDAGVASERCQLVLIDAEYD